MLEDYKDILKVKDVCDILGYSQNTVYKKLKDGLIKYHRDKTGNYIIRKNDLLDYLGVDRNFQNDIMNVLVGNNLFSNDVSKDDILNIRREIEYEK